MGERHVIQITCSSCGHELRIQDEYAGQVGQCRHCGTQVHVPPIPPKLCKEARPILTQGQLHSGQIFEWDTYSDNNSEPSSSRNSSSGRNAVYSMKGVQDLLEVFENRVAITPKGVLGFMNKGIKGTKEIPFSSIVAVQFKEAGAILSGYLQFTIPGGNESKGGLFSATKDENTFMFARKENNALAIVIKSHIDSKVGQARTPHATAQSLSDELQKLALLKSQGILSDDEFQAAKIKLIG